MTTLPAPGSIPAAVPVRLLGTGAHLPVSVVTNEEIARACGVEPAWIREHVGFVERRRAEPHEASSDLGVAAARQALERAGVAPSAVDLVICATVTPDHLFPSTAALIAQRLGIHGAGAFDLQAGCAGFVYGVVIAAQSLSSGLARRVLVVGTDVVSRLVDQHDPTVAPIFGDGAGAAVFGPASDTGQGLQAACLGSDGGGAGLLRVPAGGSRQPHATDAPGGARALAMRGPQLFKSAVRHSVAAARRVLEVARIRPDDVDLVVPHQSSPRLLEATARALGLPLDRVLINLERYGNTSCASLPIALDEAATTGRLAPGRSILLLGFGAGLTWGAGLLRT